MMHLWLGGILLVLFILNTSFQVKTYGLGEGTYYWYCGIALLLGGFSLIYRRKDGLLITLAALIPPQFFWFLDHTIRAITGSDLLGISEELYQPGLSMQGFILGHYHFILLPTLLLGMVLLKPRKTGLFPGLIALALVVFIPSYFIFPYEQNINCAQASCFETLPFLDGKRYFVLFVLGTLAAAYGVGRLLLKYLSPLSLTGKKLKKAWLAYGGVLVIGALLTGLGIYRKSEIPEFNCKAPFEDETVKIECRFINEHVKDWMVLFYKVTNKTNIIQECSSFIEFEGNMELFQDGLTVHPGTPTDVSILIHYPTKDTAIQLTATCRPL